MNILEIMTAAINMKRNEKRYLKQRMKPLFSWMQC